MKIFQQSNDYLPGTWKGLKTRQGRKASFVCPECGQLGALVDHDIGDDGTVTPSVVCPHLGCAFHEFIKLDGWNSNG